MSRSRRKTKIRSITIVSSEKQDKRNTNRKYRRIVKQLMKKRKEVLPKVREVSNTWNFSKDGKVYDAKMNEKAMRK